MNRNTRKTEPCRICGDTGTGYTVISWEGESRKWPRKGIKSDRYEVRKHPCKCNAGFRLNDSVCPSEKFPGDEIESLLAQAIYIKNGWKSFFSTAEKAQVFIDNMLRTK